MIIRQLIMTAIAVITSLPGLLSAGQQITGEQARQVLRKAVKFFHHKVSTHGGYLWRYSADLTLREGEGRATKTMVWVQPPGTPTVGQAFLDAYEATSDCFYLNAARDAAYALVQGQLHSGGWFYYIEFDPHKRKQYTYRYDLKWQPQPDPTAPADHRASAGWHIWKKRRYRTNQTILDDDTTQAAVRFLMRIDRTLQFKDQKIHQSIQYALSSLLNVQYANGAWSVSYDRLQQNPPEPEYYPPIKASYPESWSRTWTKDYTGCYVLNDNVTPDMITTLLQAYQSYGEDRYRASALKAGDFLLSAQMPDPQPAWAQQYDRHMHPVWARKFEPPAITGGESQTVIQTLMLLYSKTAKKKYLQPLPRAIAYLRKSQLSDGQLARFYELKTNRPLYFTRDYKLTYSSQDMPTHYAFIVGSGLDSIEAHYRRLRKTDLNRLQAIKQKKAGPATPALTAKVREVIDSMDDRGAWVEPGYLKFHNIQPPHFATVIDCRTFVNNVRILCRFLAADR